MFNERMRHRATVKSGVTIMQSITYVNSKQSLHTDRVSLSTLQLSLSGIAAAMQVGLATIAMAFAPMMITFTIARLLGLNALVSNDISQQAISTMPCNLAFLCLLRSACCSGIAQISVDGRSNSRKRYWSSHRSDGVDRTFPVRIHWTNHRPPLASTG